MPHEASVWTADSVSSLWSQATRVLGAVGHDLHDSTPSRLSQKQFGTGRIKCLWDTFLWTCRLGQLESVVTRGESGVGGCLCPDVLGDTSHTACPLYEVEAS